MDAARSAGIRKVLWVVLAANVGVAVAKLVVGLLAESLAVQSDAVHSGVDALNTVIGLVAVALAAAPPDERHAYGHAKIETLAAFVVACLVLLTAMELGRSAILRLFADDPTPAGTSFLVPAVMGATLAVNIAISTYEMRAGRRLRSSLLQADAAHTGSDALVTTAVLVSWGLARAGVPHADPVAALVVVFFIAWIGVGLLRRTVPVLLDAQFISAERLEDAILTVPGVEGCDRLRSRGMGDEAFLECRIRVAPGADAVAAHHVTEAVEGALERAFSIPRPNITIHVEARAGRARGGDQ